MVDLKALLLHPSKDPTRGHIRLIDQKDVGQPVLYNGATYETGQLYAQFRGGVESRIGIRVVLNPPTLPCPVVVIERAYGSGGGAAVSDDARRLPYMVIGDKLSSYAAEITNKQERLAATATPDLLPGADTSRHPYLTACLRRLGQMSMDEMVEYIALYFDQSLRTKAANNVVSLRCAFIGVIHFRVFAMDGTENYVQLIISTRRLGSIFTFTTSMLGRNLDIAVGAYSAMLMADPDSKLPLDGFKYPPFNEKKPPVASSESKYTPNPRDTKIYFMGILILSACSPPEAGMSEYVKCKYELRGTNHTLLLGPFDCMAAGGGTPLRLFQPILDNTDEKVKATPGAVSVMVRKPNGEIDLRVMSHDDAVLARSRLCFSFSDDRQEYLSCLLRAYASNDSELSACAATWANGLTAADVSANPIYEKRLLSSFNAFLECAKSASIRSQISAKFDIRITALKGVPATPPRLSRIPASAAAHKEAAAAAAAAVAAVASASSASASAVPAVAAAPAAPAAVAAAAAAPPEVVVVVDSDGDVDMDEKGKDEKKSVTGRRKRLQKLANAAAAGLPVADEPLNVIPPPERTVRRRTSSALVGSAPSPMVVVEDGDSKEQSKRKAPATDGVPEPLAKRPKLDSGSQSGGGGGGGGGGSSASAVAAAAAAPPVAPAASASASVAAAAAAPSQSLAPFGGDCKAPAAAAAAAANDVAHPQCYTCKKIDVGGKHTCFSCQLIQPHGGGGEEIEEMMVVTAPHGMREMLLRMERLEKSNAATMAKLNEIDITLARFLARP